LAEPPAAPHYGLENAGIIVDERDATPARFEEQGRPVHEPRETAGFRIAFATEPDDLLAQADGTPGVKGRLAEAGSSDSAA